MKQKVVLKMTLAEKAEKILLGEVCSECGRLCDPTPGEFERMCPQCEEKRAREIRQLLKREFKAALDESRKSLRPGEMLRDVYQAAVGRAKLDPEEEDFFSEIATVFGWESVTRPLSNTLQREWLHLERAMKPKSMWRLSTYDPLFVQHMIENLTRCGVFVIEGDTWTFKGFPKGWRRKWK